MCITPMCIEAQFFLPLTLLTFLCRTPFKATVKFTIALPIPDTIQHYLEDVLYTKLGSLSCRPDCSCMIHLDISQAAKGILVTMPTENPLYLVGTVTYCNIKVVYHRCQAIAFMFNGGSCSSFTCYPIDLFFF